MAGRKAYASKYDENSPEIIYESSDDDEGVEVSPAVFKSTATINLVKNSEVARKESYLVRPLLSSTPIMPRKNLQSARFADCDLTSIMSDEPSINQMNATIDTSSSHRGDKNVERHSPLYSLEELDDEEIDEEKNDSSSSQKDTLLVGSSDEAAHELSVLVDSLSIAPLNRIEDDSSDEEEEGINFKSKIKEIQMKDHEQEEEEEDPIGEGKVNEEDIEDDEEENKSQILFNVSTTDDDENDDSVALLTPPIKAKKLVPLKEHLIPNASAGPAPSKKTIFLPDLPSTSQGAGFGLKHPVVEGALNKLTAVISGLPSPDDLTESPPRLRVDLYRHQKAALTWLWYKEHQFPGGGILADEMGLGKTVMMLSLILKSKAEGSPDMGLIYIEEKVEKIFGFEYLEGADAGSWKSSNKKLIPSRATLIVVPPGVIGQWENEIKAKARGLDVVMFHGNKRPDSSAYISRADIVLSTYQTLLSEIPKSEQLKQRSVLVKVHWDRIILDEGHYIRNKDTAAAFACCRLEAKHRWIVTGTPIHNRPSDMFSLVKFLKVEPFNSEAFWNHWIGMRAISKLKDASLRFNTIGKALILRRTKEEIKKDDEGAPSIPSKTIIDKNITLSEKEREVYDFLHNFAYSKVKNFLENYDKEKLQRAADKFVSHPKGKGKKNEDGGDPQNFMHVFTLLLRLRQCAVLPYLIHSMIEEDDADASTTGLPEDGEEELISLKNPTFNKNFKSSKISTLIEDIDQIRKDSMKDSKHMDKIVLVSQWTTLLNIVGMHLEELGYKTTAIDGTVKISERGGIMLRFNNRTGPTIMLLSLNAGGVGLNLVGANHLFLLDLHWNPQLELQAMDRIHRFGQTKPVKIYRYISSETIEERILVLQNSKLQTASALLDCKSSSTSGFSIEDMRKLFEL